MSILVSHSEALCRNLNLQKIDPKPFTVSWLYRTKFNVDDPTATYILTFKGLNYRANVWINNQQIGSQRDIVGAFRYFDFDVTPYVQFGTPNKVQLEIFPQVFGWFLRPSDCSWLQRNSIWSSNDTDLGITFVDWSPEPPDNNLGLWREVELAVLQGPVSVRYPLVTSKVAASLASATLSITVELTNYAKSSVAGRVECSSLGVGSFQKSVTVPPGSTQVTFDASEFPLLVVANPRLWWPWQMGKPELYDLGCSFTISGSGVVSDMLTARFGIREVTDQVDSKKHRLYSVLELVLYWT